MSVTLNGVGPLPAPANSKVRPLREATLSRDLRLAAELLADAVCTSAFAVLSDASRQALAGLSLNLDAWSERAAALELRPVGRTARRRPIFARLRRWWRAR